MIYSEDDIQRIKNAESRRVDWIVGDVEKVHGNLDISAEARCDLESRNRVTKNGKTWHRSKSGQVSPPPGRGVFKGREVPNAGREGTTFQSNGVEVTDGSPDQLFTPDIQHDMSEGEVLMPGQAPVPPTQALPEPARVMPKTMTPQKVMPPAVSTPQANDMTPKSSTSRTPAAPSSTLISSIENSTIPTAEVYGEPPTSVEQKPKRGILGRFNLTGRSKESTR